MTIWPIPQNLWGRKKNSWKGSWYSGHFSPGFYSTFFPGEYSVKLTIIVLNKRILDCIKYRYWMVTIQQKASSMGTKHCALMDSYKKKCFLLDIYWLEVSGPYPHYDIPLNSMIGPTVELNARTRSYLISCHLQLRVHLALGTGAPIRLRYCSGKLSLYARGPRRWKQGAEANTCWSDLEKKDRIANPFHPDSPPGRRFNSLV